MKTNIALVLAVLCIAGYAYNRHSAKPAEAVSRNISSKAGIAAKPEAGGKRLAPAGIGYVVKRFSVSTDAGVHGFSVGKEVKIVKESSGGVTVSDGVAKVTTAKQNITNDLDVRDAAVAGDATPMPIIQNVQEEVKPRPALPIKTADQMATENRVTTVAGIQRQIADLDVRISKAQKEIGEKQAQKEAAKRMRHILVMSLSPDAANIDHLISGKNALAAKLEDAQSQH